MSLTDRDRRLYLNIFIAVILCIVITILIVSTILFISFQNIALDLTYNDNMKNLMQTSQSVQIMANTAMTLSNQIYNDQGVAKLLYYSNPEIFDIRLANDQLTNYRLSLSFIDSVYVYNGRSGTIYINASSNRNTTRDTIQAKKDFDDRECINIIDNYNSHRQYVPIPRKYTINSQEGIEKYYYTFLLYNAFSGKELDSAVIVNFSEDWIHKVMNVESEDDSSETFIIDNLGNLVSNSDRFPMMKNIAGRDYIGRISANYNAKGYFAGNVDGERYLVTYTAPDAFGWRYIRITPWKVLFSRIESMRAMTVFIGLGILAFGLLGAVLITRRLYVPIGRIITKLKSLETERKNNFEIIRQGFLKDLILGRETGSRESLAERMRDLDVRTGAEGCFRLVLLKIDGYNGFYQKYSPEDRGLFRFAIMNICTELLSKDYKTESVDMGEGNILMLLNYPAALRADNGNAAENKRDPGIDRPVSGDLLKNMKESVLKSIDISISITISGEGDSPESISHLYRQTLEASLHRLFYGRGSIIFADTIAELGKKEYKYPMQKEKQLVDALMSQKAEEAKRIYDEIVYDTSEYPFSVTNLAISHLIFTVNNTVNTIRNNNYLLADFNTALPAMLINNAETIEEVNSVFYRLFDDLEKKLDERRGMKHEETINSINAIISREYSNPALSIESIADSLVISPTYMCRLFKQYTMTTILDKIVEIRMQKAKDLLLKTEYSVADIANDTGYTNSSYFYRAFRKYYGTTPNDFRRAGSSAR